MVQMLRWFCNNWGTFSATEYSAVEALVQSHSKLQLDGDFLDLRTEAGYDACAAYLSAIDKVASALGLEVAARDYRTKFSLNYKALFPDNDRHYRVDVLEASVDQHSEIWVNGDQFELSPEARGHAQVLQEVLSDLGAVIRRWNAHPNGVPLTAAEIPSARPTKTDFATVLSLLDATWAKFECQYISELIAIEARARKLVVNASNHEQALRTFEKGSVEYAEAERYLVRCVSHLNSVANFKRKGRDDLCVDILHSAYGVLARCEDSHKDAFHGRAREAAKTMSSDVVASYQAVCNYLREVGKCVERVDPHLCNNAGLVARLADWEESWEIGSRYVQQATMLNGMCDLISTVTASTAIAPMLTSMCEDCDVELFLVLPRLVILSFLAKPAGDRAAILKGLLPHHFEKKSVMSADLRGLSDKYQSALKDIVATSRQVGSSVDPSLSAWELLLKRAVGGSAEGRNTYGDSPVKTQEVIENLMRDIERLSLELQRHCPDDWNQFSSVFVQCLIGGREREPNSKFQV